VNNSFHINTEIDEVESQLNLYFNRLQKESKSSSTSVESKDKHGESFHSNKDAHNAVENPSTNDVLIECCLYLCTNYNDCKTILGSNGVCEVVTSIVKFTDNMPLLDMCLRLIIDLLNSIRSSTSHRLSDNSNLFCEAGICEVIYRFLDDRQSLLSLH
jgi:hypothetical protein